VPRWSRANHKQLGDPKKLAKALLKLVDSDKPPLRLPLGTDTVAKIAEKNRFVKRSSSDGWRCRSPLTTPM
jgi:hypothetical protein